MMLKVSLSARRKRTCHAKFNPGRSLRQPRGVYIIFFYVYFTCICIQIPLSCDVNNLQLAHLTSLGLERFRDRSIYCQQPICHLLQMEFPLVTHKRVAEKTRSRL